MSIASLCCTVEQGGCMVTLETLAFVKEVKEEDKLLLLSMNRDKRL